MKKIRILIAFIILAGVSGGAYIVSDWSKSGHQIVVPEVSAAPLNDIAAQLMPDLGECPFQVEGKCYTCDSTEAFEVDTAQECAKCPNREAVYTGGMEIESWVCALQNCPNSHPIKAEFGNCFACDETRAINYFPENGDSGANLCPNRELNAGALALKHCPDSHPLIDPLGGCYTCDETEDVYTTPENCAGCSNRLFEAGGQFGRCYKN